jgi:prephenate dehydrogenase
MTTAIIGTGNIGGTLARHLVRGGEPVVLAAKDEAKAAALAQELGELARAASVEEAIAEADAVVFAVWLDTTKELMEKGVLFSRTPLSVLTSKSAESWRTSSRTRTNLSFPNGFGKPGHLARTFTL